MSSGSVYFSYTNGSGGLHHWVISGVVQVEYKVDYYWWCK